MGEKEKAGSQALAARHLQVLSRLPLGPLFFDRTAVVDQKLLERECADLADELALLEERLVEAATAPGGRAAEPGGVGRLLAADPDLSRDLTDLLGRILPVLGDPAPEELIGRVPVGVELHLTPERAGGVGLLKKGRLDASRN
jgi:hypothetical protein